MGIIITQVQKDRVIDLFLNSKIKYKNIAKEIGVPIEQVYEIIYEFCDKNGYGNVIRSKMGVVFKDKKENIHLVNAKEIEKWINENKRLPRLYVDEQEKGTVTDEEMRIARRMRYIMNNIIVRYEDKDISQIKNKDEREIVRIITYLKEKYKHTNTTNLEKAKELEEWSNENLRRPRQNIKGVKSAKEGEEETEEQKEVRLGLCLSYFVKTIMKEYEGISLEQITDEQDREIVRIIREIYSRFSSTNNINLINIQKIQKWCIENGRKPDYKGKIKSQGKESEQRLAYLLNYINNKIYSKYDDIDLQKITDEQDKEIIKILTDIEEKYGNQIDETDISKVSKEELGKKIVALSETRNASENQIKILANYYGVPLEKLGFSQDDDSDSMQHGKYE